MSQKTETQSRTDLSTDQPDFAFDLRWEKAAIVFLALSTLLRMAALPLMELVPDEAYYWDWARHLSWGYYDQGPMIAYVIRLTTALFGTNEFGVRIGILLASLGTLICAYILAKRMFSPMAGFLTVLLLGLTPLMEVGSLIATYDPLLVFFWLLTIVFLERALFADSPGEQNTSWIRAGFAAGLGFLSKHTMLFILPCLLLFLLLSPRHRFWLFRPQPYVAFLIFLLLYSGVIWWNSQHHWWTFQHLLFLVQKPSGTPLSRFGNFLGSQAVLLGPGLFVAALIMSIRGQISSSPQHRFLACMGLPIFVLFCLLSLKSKVQGNWAVTAWVTPPILLAAWMTALAGRSPQGRRKALQWMTVVSVLSLFVMAILLFPALRTGLGIHLKPWNDQSNTAIGWREVAARVQKSREEMLREGLGPAFLVGNGYQHCAELAFYLPDHPETRDLFLHNRLTMYAAYVEELQQNLGQNALFIDDNATDETDLRQLFESVEWEPTMEIWRRPLYNEPIRYIHIARCRNFRRYIGTLWAEGG